MQALARLMGCMAKRGLLAMAPEFLTTAKLNRPQTLSVVGARVRLRRICYLGSRKTINEVFTWMFAKLSTACLKLGFDKTINVGVILSMKALKTKRLHIIILIGKASHHAQSGNPTQTYDKTTKTNEDLATDNETQELALLTEQTRQHAAREQAHEN